MTSSPRHVGASVLSFPALVALVLAGCGKGDGLSDYERQKKKQEEAAEALRGIGGTASLKNFPPFGDAWVVELKGASLDDSVIGNLKALGRIGELNLSKSNMSDDWVEGINGIAGVTAKLDMSHTALTDAGLEKFDNLMLLMNLNLTGTKVSAAAIERFKKGREADARIKPFFKSPKIIR